jgi:hypothetical protein
MGGGLVLVLSAQLRGVSARQRANVHLRNSISSKVDKENQMEAWRGRESPGNGSWRWLKDVLGGFPYFAFSTAEVSRKDDPQVFQHAHRSLAVFQKQIRS